MSYVGVQTTNGWIPNARKYTAIHGIPIELWVSFHPFIIMPFRSTCPLRRHAPPFFVLCFQHKSKKSERKKFTRLKVSQNNVIYHILLMSSDSTLHHVTVNVQWFVAWKCQPVVYQLVYWHCLHALCDASELIVSSIFNLKCIFIACYSSRCTWFVYERCLQWCWNVKVTDTKPIMVAKIIIAFVISI